MTNPVIEIDANFKNCSPKGWMLLLNVQYLFHKKLLITAKEKPAELAMYLLIFNFSLKSQVIKKSTAMPEIPTTPNFKNSILKTPFAVLLTDIFKRFKKFFI